MEMQRLYVLMIALVTLVFNNQAEGKQIEPCLQPKVVGPCRAAIKRYYFDQKMGKCQTFFYGGCQGNANNFETLSSCQRQCECSLPKHPGPCKAYFQRFFYNSKSGQCEQFIYGGCDGNENNFKTLMDCQTTCENTWYKDSN